MKRRNDSRTRMVLARALMVLPLIAVVPAAAPGNAAAKPCSPSGGPGGDWALYGHDVENTRDQTAEHKINASNAGTLAPKWTFTLASAGSSGYLTHAIAWHSCVYFSDESEFSWGSIYAVDAKTGKLVWKKSALEGVNAPGGGAWGDVSSPLVVDGVVYGNWYGQRKQDKYAGVIVAAFDANTGRQLWQSRTIQFGYQQDALAAPQWVPANPRTHSPAMLWVSGTGPDGDPLARPGYAFLNPKNGDIIMSRMTVPTQDVKHGYHGGGIWTTATIDSRTSTLYVGTANTYVGKTESQYNESMMQLDINRHSRTFGQIIRTYKGDSDNYIFQGDYGNPACQYTPAVIPFFSSGGFNTTCGQFDVDFGGPFTLVHTPQGQTLITALQKSGSYHALDTRMGLRWRRTLAPPFVQGNQAGPANDGKHVFVSTNPGVVYALNPDTGLTDWEFPTGDPMPHHHLTVANGVLYFTTSYGTLYGLNVANGQPVLEKSLQADSGRSCPDPLVSSVTMAHHTLYVACDSSSEGGGYLVAYGLPK